MKSKHSEMPTFERFDWSIVERLSGFSNVTEERQLCLNDKFELLNYPVFMKFSVNVFKLFLVGRNIAK